MIKKVYLRDCKKWVISGSVGDKKNKLINMNIVLIGFNSAIFKTFNTEKEADNFLREVQT